MNDQEENYQQQEEEQHAGAAGGFRKVEELENYSVAKTDITKLKTGGFHTLESIAHNSMRRLAECKGLSEQKIQKFKDIIKANELVQMGFQTAATRLTQQNEMIKISTGSSDLDALLGGGIETGSLTEIFGEFRTGKTQMMHTLACMAQRPLDQGGAEGRVIYIDTEGTFRPLKLTAIAERFDMNPEEVLDNVICARAHNSEQQMELLQEAAALMSDSRFALLIVDSATNLYRTDYNGRGELSERQMQLGQFLRQLTRLTEEFGIAVVLTNQVVSDPGGMSFAKDSTKPIGGNIIAHASTTRLKFKKGRGDNRVCMVYDSPNLPECECGFSLGPTGIENAKDL
mmetsp:Transcript_4188/g.4347  ORF Transcript_4188/g.4347 Transcript_4188/m.4347 type:complete len:343 (+) Transcript_4188:219-1247(+)|eukprot:CAMPEP_0119042704 /NCGR_PEP_ID=MMETSP1177-20130426/16097_1 /TAXON_ID=2985 /ORGANISM="Ochromonas sp, Strain CCMP1899" /LENGTH=342 /DNA_ID=CAMNT_0007009677 /DNA_START=184 /DNA_END=1212 /DNA_ORIENTATION=+